MNLEWLGYTAAILTTAAFLPQALKTLRTRDTRGISLSMYIIFVLGILFWFAYGVALGSWPMIIANAITFLLSGAILVLKLRYR